MFHHCLRLASGLSTHTPKPTTSIPLCVSVSVWGGGLTPGQVLAVSPHLPIGSIPTSQAMSASQRLLRETVSLLVVNPGVSVKQETEVGGGGVGTHSLATVSPEPPEAAGSCSSHHDPVLPLTPVQPQTRVLKCLYLQGKGSCCPRICLGSLTTILRRLHQGAGRSRCPRGQWEL